MSTQDNYMGLFGKKLVKMEDVCGLPSPSTIKKEVETYLKTINFGAFGISDIVYRSMVLTGDYVLVHCFIERGNLIELGFLSSNKEGSFSAIYMDSRSELFSGSSSQGLKDLHKKYLNRSGISNKHTVIVEDFTQVFVSY